MDPFSSKQKRVMIIAGEASGDLHGSNLVRAMRKRDTALFFFGIGGPALKNEGVNILVDASDLAVVGITEVFNKITSILKGMSIAKKALKKLRPDLLILIDLPDFNLRLAPTAKKLGIPVLYYICPQVWAWRSGRIKKMRKLADHLAVILPFEEDFYKAYDMPVTFVGHPLLDNHLFIQDDTLEMPADDTLVIGFLPGSRDREISRHLPVMLDAALILLKKLDSVKFIISLAPGIEREYMEKIIENHGGDADFEIVTGGAKHMFKRSELVVAVSGTVTLETAIFGMPTVIIYKVSPISYWLGRAMIRVEHIGLANLIAGKKIVPELLQEKASPIKIADTVFELLSDASGLEEMRRELLNVKDILGGPGASERVADIALGMLSS